MPRESSEKLNDLEQLLRSLASNDVEISPVAKAVAKERVTRTLDDIRRESPGDSLETPIPSETTPLPSRRSRLAWSAAALVLAGSVASNVVAWAQPDSHPVTRVALVDGPPPASAPRLTVTHASQTPELQVTAPTGQPDLVVEPAAPQPTLEVQPATADPQPATVNPQAASALPGAQAVAPESDSAWVKVTSSTEQSPSVWVAAPYASADVQQSAAAPQGASVEPPTGTAVRVGRTPRVSSFTTRSNGVLVRARIVRLSANDLRVTLRMRCPETSAKRCLIRSNGTDRRVLASVSPGRSSFRVVIRDRTLTSLVVVRVTREGSLATTARVRVR